MSNDDLMIEQMLHDKNSLETARSIEMIFIAIFMKSFMLQYVVIDYGICTQTIQL